MKWVVAILLCVFFLIFGMLSFASEPDGFNGMKWGTSLKEFEEKGLVIEGTLTKKKDFDGTEIDEISGHSFLLGDIEFNWVTYSFYKNKFFRASALFNPAELGNELYLFEVLKGKYGFPKIDTYYIFVNEEGRREIDSSSYDPKHPGMSNRPTRPLDAAFRKEIKYMWYLPTTTICISIERHLIKTWIRSRGYIFYEYKPKTKETFDKL